MATKDEMFERVFDAARGTIRDVAANDHERMALTRYLRTALSRFTKNELAEPTITDDMAALLVQAQRGYRDFMAKRGRPVRAADKRAAQDKAAIAALKQTRDIIANNS